ncbi:hypothetical protein ACIP5Y_21450 [Nocardia sp. NPDC088792]|uniref:hypothetical protein n=1 Tax=Nocardia sp. NPDC088792 TaxID=3364332 RepID=UPI003818219C
MSSSEALIAGATFFGGTGTSAFFSWLRARKRAPSENLRYEIAAAKDINEMALKTLERVSGDLDNVSHRLGVVEAAQETTVRELNRVTCLFREAIEALRDVIEAARHGRVPELLLSTELMHELHEDL